MRFCRRRVVVLELFLLEGEADALFDGEARVDFSESGRGFFEWEAEGDEGIEGFVSRAFFRGESELGFGGAVMAGEADFVAEVDNDALGGLFADTTGFGDECNVIIGDSITDFFGSTEAQDRHSGFRADSVDGDEHFKKLFGGETSKAIEIFTVFADGVVGVEFGFTINVDRLGVVRTDGKFVANAMDVDDDEVLEFFSDFSDDVGDHEAIFCACDQTNLEQ